MRFRYVGHLRGSKWSILNIATSHSSEDVNKHLEYDGVIKAARLKAQDSGQVVRQEWPELRSCDGGVAPSLVTSLRCQIWGWQRRGPVCLGIGLGIFVCV